MKKRSLWLITSLMTIALLGVFVMQLYYIREAYNLKSQLFEHDVNEVLNSVVNKVQKRYAANHISKKDAEVRQERERDFRDKAQQIVDFKENFRAAEEERKFRQKKRIFDDLNTRDSLIRETFLDPRRISEDVFLDISRNDTKGQSPLKVQVDLWRDEFGVIKGGSINQTIEPTVKQVKPRAFSLNSNDLPDSLRYLAIDRQSSRFITITLEQVRAEMALKFKIEDKIAEQRYRDGLKDFMDDTVALNGTNLNYLADLEKEMRQKYVPIARRVNREELDTLLKKELLNRNITLNYDFWLKMANKDSLVYRKASTAVEESLQANTFKTTLFNKDIFGDPGVLYVNFPNKNSLILGNMWTTMASSAGLLLVLVFIFSYTLYAILRQKKISEMKTDFINNMTHEFKTPVATIMIASEALKDPEIIEDKKRISRLAGIIYDENVRLGNHIERVLSIARLEKKELKLEEAEVNLNDLVMVVLDSMDLQLQKKAAKVELALDAIAPIVVGDELHLSNVLYNLIDNANKYSTEQPRITIKTRNTAKGIVVSVADEGIGMTKEQSKRIFDQFYRVPTGNLHDVKGFGLGLNYVQDIITQMGGNIKVHSEKDKGTEFIISLPLN
ncbi:sensor histidine kinase [Pedobacter sp. JCM 36344]|uniref:sensor histidine kinase n=1 Tax=Pedobacter sp. JCM 36344 TaxID=3374280 RepID=UPI0039791D84